jgi:hypothetical protein
MMICTRHNLQGSGGWQKETTEWCCEYMWVKSGEMGRRGISSAADTLRCGGGATRGELEKVLAPRVAMGWERVNNSI